LKELGVPYGQGFLFSKPKESLCEKIEIAD